MGLLPWAADATWATQYIGRAADGGRKIYSGYCRTNAHRQSPPCAGEQPGECSSRHPAETPLTVRVRGRSGELYLHGTPLVAGLPLRPPSGRPQG